MGQKSSRQETMLINAVRKDKNLQFINRINAVDVDIDAVDEDGLTALMWAVIKGTKGMFLQLLVRNASVDRVDNTGKTALIHACIHDRGDMVDDLVLKGADIKHAKMYAEENNVVANLKERTRE